MKQAVKSPYRKRVIQPNGLKHKKAEKIFSFNEADNRLYDIFRNHNFEHISHEQRHQLVRFYQLLMENQKKQNFTRIINFKDIAIKHFIDCLIVDQLVELKFPLLDIGTGPGFPGIPLKILYPNGRIMLAEGVRKRVDYLKEVRDKLQLTNLDIIGRNINEDFLLPTEMVITRALSQIVPTLNMVKNSLVNGGQVVFMKGPNVFEEIELAKKHLDCFHLLKVKEYTLPNTQNKRSLVIFQKSE